MQGTGFASDKSAEKVDFVNFEPVKGLTQWVLSPSLLTTQPPLHERSECRPAKPSFALPALY